MIWPGENIAPAPSLAFAPTLAPDSAPAPTHLHSSPWCHSYNSATGQKLGAALSGIAVEEVVAEVQEVAVAGEVALAEGIPGEL